MTKLPQLLTAEQKLIKQTPSTSQPTVWALGAAELHTNLTSILRLVLLILALNFAGCYCVKNLPG